MSYLLNQPGIVWMHVLQHLQMVGIALAIAVSLALPLALLVYRYRWLRVPVLGILGILYTVPSLALIILLISQLGLNARPVIAAMVVYTQVILVQNLVVGLEAIPPAVLEAARGMGMSAWQRWWQVQLPLILPIFLAGLRIAAVVAIAIATIGAKSNAGGLGTLLFDGIAQNRNDKIWAGAIAVSLLALVINTLLLILEAIAHPGPNRHRRARRTQARRQRDA